jgi:phage repressor protein C with HTH and peptisase S24 domain
MLAGMELSEVPERLKRMGQSQAALARHLQLDPSSLTKTLKGARKLTVSELRKMEDFFGESLSGPSPERVSRPIGRRIPVYGYAAAGGEDRIALASDQVLDWVDAPPFWNGSGELIMVRIVGDSMEPRYFAGERVPVRRGLPPGRGSDCLVELNDDSALLKVFRGMRDGTLFLSQYNPGDAELRVPLTQVRAVHAAGLEALG